VIFMQRPMTEVLASQDQMLRRRGTYKEGADPKAMGAAFEKHLREVYAWMEGKPHVKSMRVAYHDVLRDAKVVGAKVAEFLGIEMDVEAMAGQVDAALYRNRR